MNDVTSESKLKAKDHTILNTYVYPMELLCVASSTKLSTYLERKPTFQNK